MYYIVTTGIPTVLVRCDIFTLFQNLDRTTSGHGTFHLAQYIKSLIIDHSQSLYDGFYFGIQNIEMWFFYKLKKNPQSEFLENVPLFCDFSTSFGSDRHRVEFVVFNLVHLKVQKRKKFPGIDHFINY